MAEWSSPHGFLTSSRRELALYFYEPPRSRPYEFHLGLDVATRLVRSPWNPLSCQHLKTTWPAILADGACPLMRCFAFWNGYTRFKMSFPNRLIYPDGDHHEVHSDAQAHGTELSRFVPAPGGYSTLDRATLA